MPFFRQFSRISATVSPILVFLLLCFRITVTHAAADASLSFAPSGGAYLVGSVFNVSIVLDTHGQQINTVELHMMFPPDILQVTKPAGDTSFIQTWLFPPSFSNSEGVLKLSGGIGPGGINTSNGLVTTMTFRAGPPRDASLTILKTSRVLAHDGKGTDVLGSRGSATFTIRVRPPEGPEVTSPTHQDPNRWYQNNAPTFTWGRGQETEVFSYLFDENAEGIPLATPQTADSVKSYTDVPDGIRYFHVRVFRGGAWSGASHIPIRIDTAPPLPFTPKVEYAPQLGAPPLIFFETKDAHAGVDHYAVKVIRTDEANNIEQDITPFFVETESPYKVPVEFPGKYTVIVRSFDYAGNTRDAMVSIVTPTIALLSDQGIKFKNYFIPFKFVYTFFALLLLVLFLWGMYLLKNLRAIRLRVRRDVASLSEDMQKEYSRFGEHLVHELERSRSVESKKSPGEVFNIPEPPAPE